MTLSVLHDNYLELFFQSSFIVPAYYLCCYLTLICTQHGKYECMMGQSLISVTKKNETEDAANDHEDELPLSAIDGVKTFAFSLHSHTVGTAL